MNKKEVLLKGICARILSLAKKYDPNRRSFDRDRLAELLKWKKEIRDSMGRKVLI